MQHLSPLPFKSPTHLFGRLLCSTLLLNVGACQATDEIPLDKFHLDNTLSACIQFTPQSVLVTDASIVLQVKASQSKSLAECLCMSTLMDYRVVDEYEIDGITIQNELVRGFKNSVSSNQSVNIVVATDEGYVPEGDITISLKCRPHQ